jgi:spore coat polysaccharide biosynthesis predicted glycosyltransferase SpsG
MRAVPGRVLLRTSAAAHIGLGHLMRCLALAEAFAEAGWAVTLYGTVADFVAPRWAGFVVIAPNHDETDCAHDWHDHAFLAAIAEADLVVTDLYALDDAWRQRCPCPVLAVSDPPHWPGPCALTLMPTWFPLEALPARTLAAPQHCLIARDIRACRPAAPPSASAPARLLVSCGGGEDLGLAARCLRALAADPRTRTVQGTVILGALSEAGRAEAIAAAKVLPGMVLHERVADMAAVLTGHTLAFGTPAGAALERACLGMAQILLPIVDNQCALAEGLALWGIAQVLPRSAQAVDISDAVALLLADPAQRAALGAQGWQRIDGRGAAGVVRAVQALFADPSLPDAGVSS